MASLNQSQSKQAYRDFVTVSALLEDFYIERGKERGVDGRIDLFIELEERLKNEARLALERVESSRSREKMLWVSRIEERRDWIEQQVTAAYDQADAETSFGEDEYVDSVPAKEASDFGTDVNTWLDFLALEIPWSISSKQAEGERYRAYSYLEDVLNDTIHFSSAITHVRWDGRFYWLVIGESSRKKKSSRA